MTNKERYKQAFSALQTSRDFSKEAENMKLLSKRHRRRTAAAAVVACLAVVGGAGTAYAANIGGIQRTVQIWLHGDQTSAMLEIEEDGSYTLHYPDEDGEPREQGGGGIAYEPDGTQRPLTEEEIMEQLDAPEVEYTDDGRVWIYYHSQALEITDNFDDQGICYVKLEGENKTLYVTVKYQNGYSYSENKFPEAWSFN